MQLVLRPDLFNPIKPGGGGGLEARMTKFTTVIQKHLALWCPNFVTVVIFEIRSDEILGILVIQGGCYYSFHQDVSKMFKMINFPPLENCWNWHGGQFWVEKDNSGYNNLFSRVKPFSWGKYLNSMMSHSFLDREILWHHISKIRKATKRKFCIRHAFITIMIQAQFDFNRLNVTLIFGIRTSEYPLASQTTQKAGLDTDNIRLTLLDLGEGAGSSTLVFLC